MGDVGTTALPSPMDGEDGYTSWRQGDAVLGDIPFPWGYARHSPMHQLSQELAQEVTEEDSPEGEFAIAQQEVSGIVIVTQTCDLVRDWQKRPFVQVAPISVLPPEDRATRMAEIRRRKSTRYLYLPALEQDGMVAELDRIFTLEKGVLDAWCERRIHCCRTEEESHLLSQTVRRYYSRPALPNSFCDGVLGLQNLFEKKHDKNPGGQKKFHPGACLRCLETILVKAYPRWETYDRVEFTLVQGTHAEDIPPQDWESFKQECLSLVTLPPGVRTVWNFIPYEALPARQYRESIEMDFEFLSHGK
jgi:hypothetical protein